ncbi:hypothetical protein [Amnibacterium endophyticum]|uniref:Uncharacterized protein n=1 Tax=Amnibacterium endophyticum TaxID=2109337 RepID=A0ABW4LIE1_9MICO
MGETIAAAPAATLECGPRGRPRLLRWAGRVFRVTDAPTPLEDALGGALTHPLPVRGWRFQGTSTEDGDSLVFDVLACADGWRVVHTYR